MIEPINGHEKEVAELLSEYWQSRGMHEYDEKWAKEYLREEQYLVLF